MEVESTLLADRAEVFVVEQKYQQVLGQLFVVLTTLLATSTEQSEDRMLVCTRC
jgi:hypothetical protein